MGKERKRWNWRSIVGWILFATLILSIVYSLISVINAPVERNPMDPHAKIKSDYMLMLVQCMLAVVVMFLPSIVQKRWNLAIPNYMYILFFIFLYCAVYLGEVRNFYYLVPHWDTILHTFSGVMLGALGFTLVEIFNSAERVPINLSPFFVAFFAFCFALAAGAVWEIYEFSLDGLMGMNMQKYALADGTLRIGRDAVCDTMKDIIVDALGALIMSVVGYIMLKRGKWKNKAVKTQEEE